jgi:hypothetical protein
MSAEASGNDRTRRHAVHDCGAGVGINRRLAIHIQPTGDGFETTAAAMAEARAAGARRPRRPRDVDEVVGAAGAQDSASTKVMKYARDAGIDGRASASVKLVDRDGTIVWSYSVTDQDERDRIARRSRNKSDYFGSKGSQRADARLLAGEVHAENRQVVAGGRVSAEHLTSL